MPILMVLFALTVIATPLAMFGFPFLRDLIDGCFAVFAGLLLFSVLISAVMVMDVTSTLKCYSGNQESCKSSTFFLPTLPGAVVHEGTGLVNGTKLNG